MSDPKIDLELKLKDEKEKLRINSMKTLAFLGYTKDASKMTQEQLDARIELLMEQKSNETKDATTPTPVIFKGIDEERENAEAVEQAQPNELDKSEYMKGYDALTALIPQLRPNSQVGHMEQLADRKDIRIIRLPASIKLNSQTTIIRRVVL
jgi:hypothetical protein